MPRPAHAIAAAAATLLLISGQPSLADDKLSPAPPHADLYLACIAQAASVRSVMRDGRYLILSCAGEPAHNFFDALGARPPKVAYEETRPTGVFRFTERPRKDTVGLDFCSRDLAQPEAGYACTLTFPVGSFLDE